MEVPDTPQLRQILARRDITALYRALKAAGWSHARIAGAAGQSVSQISEILAGRQVMAYDLLVRICEGLKVPRGHMGLAYDETTEEERKPDELDEDVKRRVMFGVASLALFGAPVLGEILELPKPSPAPTPLPSRLASSDVRALRGCTQALRAGARSLGGGGQPVSEVAVKGLRLLAIPADDDVATDLKSALAELHTLAGWSCVDSGLHDSARYHFGKAMELAQAAGDQAALADAFWHAGVHMMDAGANNDGLKAYQLGLTACDCAPENAEVVALLTISSAHALANLGQRQAALRALGQSRDAPFDPFDAAMWDYTHYQIHYGIGNIDRAAEYAKSAVEKWEAEG